MVDYVESVDAFEESDLSPSKGSSKKFHSSIIESFSPMERRYSFANKNSANIDLGTIDDIEILDYAIRVANDHGIFSRCKRQGRYAAKDYVFQD